jgi:hypothetical protein
VGQVGPVGRVDQVVQVGQVGHARTTLAEESMSRATL